MTKILRNTLLVLVGVMLIASSGFASEWVVAQNGDPDKDFDDLTTAFATLGAYAGTHNIVIREGNYTDEGLTAPGNITSVVGDGADVVIFTGTGTADFVNVSNVPSGFVLSGMKITGYIRGVGGWTGSNAATISDNLFVGNYWGVAFAIGCTGKTVQDNCFIGSITSNTYDDDSNVWDHNYYDDYTVATYYDIGGTGGMQDTDPQVLDNSAYGPSSAELGETFTVEIRWTVPDCEATRDLAACNFDVTYNASKLAFVSAEFNTLPQDGGGFFGDEETGGDALYIGPDGSVPGTVHFAASNWTSPVTWSGVVGYVTFTALMANTSVNVHVGSLYLDGNNNPLVVDYDKLQIFLQDVTPPELTITAFADDDNDANTLEDPADFDNTYSDGSSAGSGPFVRLFLDVAATDDYDLDYLEYNWNGAGWTNWGTYNPLSGTSFTMVSPHYLAGAASQPEGACWFGVRVYDKAGLYDEETYNFTIDRTGPVLVSMAMSDATGCSQDPDNYTNDRTVNLVLTDDGLDVIKDVDLTFTSWGANPRVAWNPTSVDLPDAEAAHKLWARAYDPWNNQGNYLIYIMTLDRIAPPTTQDFAFTVAKTSTVNVFADVTGFSAYGYIVTEDPADIVCDGAWNTSLSHPFGVTLNPPDGIKTYYFSTVDIAGNMSPVQQDDIELDTQGPEFDDFTVVSKNGFPCSNSWTVSVTANWSDTDVKKLKLGSATGSYNLTIDVTGLNTYTTDYTIVGGTVNDMNSVFGVLRDDILNYGSEASDAIFVDGTNPSLTAIEMKDLTSGSSIFSNDAEVAVEMTGSTDIKEIRFSEDNSTWGAWGSVDFTSGSATVNYTFASPAENTYLPLYAEVRDCSGRTGSNNDAGGIIFDLTAPVINSVVINGGAAKTNNENLNVGVNWTDVYPDNIAFSESATMSTTGYPLSNPPPQTFTFTVATGDGTKDVYVQVEDRAGNLSDVHGPTSIELDQTPPAGTYVVEQPVSANPYVTPGYTNDRNVMLTTFVVDPDAVQMYVVNTDGGGDGSPAGYFAIADMPWVLTFGQGTKTLDIYFKDDANNWGPAVPGSIIFDKTPPAPPTAFTASPQGSALLEWSIGETIQFYFMRYNYNGDYPEYTNTNPPAPGWNQGFPADGPIVIPGNVTEWAFAGPHMDIYCFSMWSVDMAGNKSTSYAGSNLSTNYVGGDYLGGSSADGCIDYETEFGAFAQAYNSYEGGLNDEWYNPELDIDPLALDGYYPLPDDDVDFGDFVVFGMNYHTYNCAKTNGGGSKPVVSQLAMEAVVPAIVEAGEIFTVAFNAEQSNAILGYNLVLDFDREKYTLESVTPGAMHESVQKAFFYTKNETGVDIAAVALGGQFQGEEMFTLTFRSEVSGPVALEATTVDVRDWSNNVVEVTFEVTAKAEVLIPTEFALSQNYPNPFNPATTIDLSLPVASEYTLQIYNIAGQLVESFTGYADAGIVTISWDASNYSSGIYLYRVEAGTFTDTKKMVLLK